MGWKPIWLTILLIPTALAMADDPVPPVEEVIQASSSSVAVLMPIAAMNQEESATAAEPKTAYDTALEAGSAGVSDVCSDSCFLPRIATRFGWWGISRDGSENKVGEYQDLDPSPFWDIDALLTDGQRTWDFTLSGLDNETNFGRLFYYGSDLTAKV